LLALEQSLPGRGNGGFDGGDVRHLRLPQQIQWRHRLITPLHGFLPFLTWIIVHPDWAVALAASANGKAQMEEFNREFHHKLIWIPWQRPGFELA